MTHAQFFEHFRTLEAREDITSDEIVELLDGQLELLNVPLTDVNHYPALLRQAVASNLHEDITHTNGPAVTTDAGNTANTDVQPTHASAPLPTPSTPPTGPTPFPLLWSREELLALQHMPHLRNRLRELHWLHGVDSNPGVL